MMLASRQHGVVTRVQLLGAGVSSDMVDRRLKAGRLRRLLRGVYLVGPLSAPHTQEMASVLTCGDDAVVSHRSAAALWGMLPLRDDSASVDVIVVGGRPRHRAGLRVHCVRTLHPDEVTRFDGIPITTPARTLYDLAACVAHRELERALAEGFAQRLTSHSHVLSLMRRHPRRRGVDRLLALIERGASPPLTRSAAEEQFLGLIRKAQLREPEVNMQVEGYEVDFVWRSERLVVEIDGRAFHSSDRSFESDRRRDGVLVAAGLRVMRVTWRQIVNEPEALLVRLTQALARPWG